ncbi:MAG TPA: urease accessory protein UreF, partial [Cellvibrionaceae bacterium]|nr:urease accessory protein UreF [Cellvibrionaceae bacterium]
QQILAHLMPHIPTICVAAASRQEDELGRGLPGLAMASSLHESQYSRLFRS